MTRAISGAIIPLKFIEPSCKIDVNLLVSRHENLYSTRERHAEFIGGKIFADPCRTAYILIQTLTRSSNSFSLSLSFSHAMHNPDLSRNKSMNTREFIRTVRSISTDRIRYGKNIVYFLAITRPAALINSLLELNSRD